MSARVSARARFWSPGLGLGILNCAFFISLAVAILASPAFAATAPHVADSPTTDSCAICHRAHVPNVGIGYRILGVEDRQSNALLFSDDDTNSDLGVCYTCHGIGALGASTDVETSMALASRHSVDTTAAWGPSPKMCGDCHDSHGQDRNMLGDPFPFLLRSWEDSSTLVFEGEEYCTACHDKHVAGAWDGLGVYQDTAHFVTMPTPASGTGVRCSICHAPHGSDSTPLITPVLLPPGASESTAVPANDRRLCQGCHTASLATWSGPDTYTSSAHALSDATVAVEAEWATATISRRVGECQTCHAPMGVDDGAGGALPEMVRASGRQLCDRCHDADGPASTDMSSTAYPASETVYAELSVVYAPSADTSSYGRLAVYSRDTTGTDPRALIGPREYTVPGVAGAAAAGDLELDGRTELIVADRSVPRLTVYTQEADRGVTRHQGPGILALGCGVPAGFVAVADFTDAGGDTAGRPEVAVVDVSGAQLWFYRLSGSALTTVAGPFTVGGTPTGLAAGDVVSTALAEAVVTASGTDRLYIASDSGAGLAVTSSATGPSPAGPSIGDAWEVAGQEIVLVNRTAATATVSVYGGGGAKLADYTAATGTVAGARPTATAIGNVLANHARDEIVVALEDPTSGDSVINLFEQLTVGGPGWITPPTVRSTGAGRGTRSVLVADIDGDLSSEIIAGNGGTWSKISTGTAPSQQVFRADGAGTALAAGSQTYAGGGTELAGGTTALMFADLGPVGPSRHPIDAVGSHASTETAPFARHVTCSDCHNSHESTPAAAAAPAVPGVLLGAWGVPVTNVSTTSVTFGPAERADAGYEVCFKCHSGSAALDGRRDLALEFDTLNTSVHAVEAAAAAASNTAGSFVATTPAWSATSVLHCTDCHGTTSSGSVGPHSSSAAPILRSPYLGALTAATDLLCYRCHKATVYNTGTEDRGSSASMFYDSPPATSTLHAFHTTSRGVACGACHASHGSSIRPHLISSGVAYSHSATGGACTSACHLGSWRSYERRTASVVVTASSGVAVVGTSGVGQDYTLTWVRGTPPALAGSWLIVRDAADNTDVRFTFDTGMSRPTTLSVTARASAANGEINADVYDYYTGTWTNVGSNVLGTAFVDLAWPVGSSRYVSNGSMQVRIWAASNRNLYLDYLGVSH